MRLHPGFDDFAKAYNEGKPQAVWTRLIADLETPVSAMLKLGADKPMSFLLESVEGGAVRGRYSVLGFDPDIIWRATGDEAEINRNPARSPNKFTKCKGGTLKALRALLDESRIDLPDSLPPMALGVFGYMGYDTVRLIEKLPEPNPDPIGIPEAVMIRPTLMAIFDNVKDEITVVTPVRPNKTLSAKAAYSRALDRLNAICDELDKPLAHAGAPNGADIDFPKAVSNTTPKQYAAMVRKAKKYIAAGDIFQVVLSQRYSAPFDLPPFTLYRALRRVNPSPFLYFLNFGDYAIAGSSPEILVRARQGQVTIRPIAGTRPRGNTPEEDRAMAEELLADEKERSEHLMLLDLGRNDVGRVAKLGTVRVTDSFFLEYYSQVMHIVSNVTGELSDEHDAVDALMAGFPAGTVSGAPKVRAMEIIDELEKEKRGLYAGCVGYFSATGDMDSAIVLRTSLIKDGTMYVQAGAGIVADSIPENELRECEAKAGALFRAAEEAVRFASQNGRGQ
ncbi:MAG TPA: anthranilate synthase component I [Hyphomicrobiales bacterium]|nr:anthranilate synthase component I [Hyphomicrobiales bacterium]